MTKETLTWLSPEGRVQYKFDQEYFCVTQSGHKIYRKENDKELIFQFFLDNRSSYQSIVEHFNQTFSWASFQGSIIYFYGGNYIYCKGIEGFKEICKVLNIKINWN